MGNNADTTTEGNTSHSDWEQILHRMGRIRAELGQLEEKSSTFSPKTASAISLISAEFENLMWDVVEYEEGNDMPDECPVCGEEITTIDELNKGRSYSVEKMCINEKTTGGPGHGILHFSDNSDEVESSSE